MPLLQYSTVYFLMIIFSPCLGCIINFILMKKNSKLGSKLSGLGVWIGFINCWVIGFFKKTLLAKGSYMGILPNEISWIASTLILFVSGIVHHFSQRYISGDRLYGKYFSLLGLVTISTLFMVACDHLLLILLFWTVSNSTLVLLMIHKYEWAAAKHSGLLSLKTLGIGVIFLALGFLLLGYGYGSFSLKSITSTSAIVPDGLRSVALLLIALGAFAQSGVWPFHRWLISSLNSPTPVSALMHAGLINGGGLLLIRFSTLFLKESQLLLFTFSAAIFSVILGGIWKLMQGSVKRMLACSTMAQMGFTLMQCSLGLFPAALAHLCWHGLFKAFLFLKSGSNVTPFQSAKPEPSTNLFTIFLSMLCGFIGTLGFILTSQLSFTFSDTTVVILCFCWMASTQLAFTLLQRKHSPILFIAAIFACFVSGLIYGYSVKWIESTVASLQIWQPQPLHWIHVIGVALIFFVWMALSMKILTNYERFTWWKKFYIQMLNASQPASATITSVRTSYKY